MEPPTKKPKEESTSSDNQEDTETDIAKNRVCPLPNLQYDILRTIFQFLRARDLSNAACVCKSWNEAASNELDSRMSPEFNVNEFNKCEKNDKTNTGGSQLADELKIKPYFGLIFGKYAHHYQKFNPKRFVHYLPPTCKPLVMVKCHDITVDFRDTEKDEQLAVATFLPNIPNLRVDRFKTEISRIFEADSELRNGKRFLEKVLSSTQTESVCIIMIAYYDLNMIPEIAEHFRKIYKPGTVALWGGVVPNIKNYKTAKFENFLESTDDDTRGMIICLSSPSLRSWSIVLTAKCKSRIDMELRLQEFREKIQLRKHSLALMCACIERLNNKNNEIGVFKKVFPEVPLIGFHGDGEFGLNTLSKKRMKALNFALSTVFLVLTYD